MKIKTLFLSFLAILFMAKMGYAQTADYLGQIKSSSDPLDVIYNRIDSLVATDTSSQNLRNVKEYLRFRNIWDKRLPGNTLGSRVDYANYVTQNAANPICNQTDLAAWQIMGPLTYESDNRQYNGLVKEVLCNPNDPNDIILGALESGIWKYRNATNTWENVTDVLNLPGLSVSELIRNPFQPSNIIASTGVESAGETVYGTGILQSNDYGETWQLQTSFPSATYPYLTKVVVDQSDVNPADGLTLYAASRGKIFKTTNYQYTSNGSPNVTWTEITPPPPCNPNITTNWNHYRIYDFEISSSGKLFVSVYYPYNNTWSSAWECNDGLGLNWVQLFQDKTFGRMYFAKPTGNLVYAVLDYTSDNSNYHIFKSSDYGVTWAEVLISKFPKGSPIYSGEPWEFDYSPESETLFGANYHSIYIMKENGTPVVSSTTLLHADARDFSFMPSVNNVQDIYIATDGGLMKLTRDYANNTSSSANMNGDYLPITQFVGLAVNPLVPDMVAAGATHNHLFFNDGQSWSMTLGGDGGECAIAPINKKVYWEANAGFYKSSIPDNGSLTSTTTIYYSTPVARAKWFIGMDIDIDPRNSSIVYQGRGIDPAVNLARIVKYNEETNNYSLINVPSEITEASPLCPTPDGWLYVSTHSSAHGNYPNTTDRINNLLVKTNNDGTTWTDLTQSPVYHNGQSVPLKDLLPWRVITDIKYDELDPQRIWITLGGFFKENNIPVAEKYRVLYSPNGGGAWYDYSEGLPCFPALCLEKQPGSDDRLFVGTDVGVFYRDKTMSSWECFRTGMPPALVTDLEFNQCTNELFLSTNGYGTWKTSLDMFTNSANRLTENTTINWDYDVHLSSKLIIPQGTTLNVSSTLYMAEDTKIVIERGGRLVLDGGKITSGICGGPWLGIEVQGNSDEIQAAAYQGVLEINGGTIENAICAVKTYKPDPSMETDPLDPQYSGLEGWTGGMVLATNATFRNNRMGVVFPYYRLGSTSFFERCTFETTGTLPDESTPGYFVTMNSITGVHFYGCTFQNTNPDPTLVPENRGSGIYSYNSSLYLMENSSTSTMGTFSKLYYGVRDLSAGVNWPSVVEKQNFLDNFRGIYLSGRNYTDFTENQFRPYNEQVSQNPQTYGAYFDQCTGYHIEANTFDSEITSRTGIGLVIHKSGSEANEVYRNTFSNLRYATIAQSYNRGRDSEGLCYKCNTFTNNLYDIKISRENANLLSTMDGIAAHQGANITGDHLAPAGNTFTNSNSYSFLNSGNSIIYYRHSMPLNMLPLLHPYFNQGTGSVVVNSVTGTNYELACPSKLEPSGGYSDDKGLMDSAEAEAAALKTSLNALVDGGNTPILTQTVETSTSLQSLELRDELLFVSPFLSDSVLSASIGQEEALPNPLLRDVLVANPQTAKTDELLEKLDDRQDPMPNEMWNEVMAGENVVSDKEKQEGAIGFWINEQYYRWCQINRSMLRGTAPADSVQSLWATTDHIEATFNSALHQFAEGNSTACLTIIDNALSASQPQSKEWNDLYALKGYVETMAPTFPVPDTSTAILLENLTGISDGIPQALSRNALIQMKVLDYNEPILIDDGFKTASVRRFGIRPVEQSDARLLRVYPNPANSYLVAEIKITANSGQLQLVNSSGIIVLEMPGISSGSVTIRVGKYSAGVYTLRLIENGEIKATAKITLQ